MALLLRFLPYLIGIGAVIGAYIYWYDHTYTEGYDDAAVAYEKRDAATLKKAEDLLHVREAENSAILEDQQSRYMGAIESYAKHIEDINATAIDDANKRLYVNTKTTNTCSNAMSTGSGDTSRIDSGGGGVYQSELAEEVTRTIRANAREVALGVASCQKLLDIVAPSVE